jgi:hypothetical protein
MVGGAGDILILVRSHAMAGVLETIQSGDLSGCC